MGGTTDKTNRHHFRFTGALATLLIPLLAILATFFVPEVRHWMGLESESATKKGQTESPPSPSPEESPSQTHPAVNLLSLVDLSEDSQSGDWSTDNGKLVGKSAGEPAALTIPYSVPDQYTVELSLTLLPLKQGLSELYIMLPVDGGSRQFVIRQTDDGQTVFDFMGPPKQSFGKVPGRGVTVGSILGRKITLKIGIHRDKPTVSLDGSPITKLHDYGLVFLKSDPSPMLLPASTPPKRLSFVIPQEDRLQIVFHSMELIPASGEGH